MRRREFITLLGGAAAPSILWPHAAHAQQPTMPVIGFLSVGAPERLAEVTRGFNQGLNEAGFFDGRNVVFDYRLLGPDDQYDRLAAIAADLVRRQVAVIVTVGALPIALAAKAATSTIPVVFSIGGDPVQIGLVASLARPGGNLTGATNLNTELLPKRLELLHEIVPAAANIALLLNPTNPAADRQSRDLQAAARALGLQLHILKAGTEHDFDTAFATLAQLRADGLVIAGDGLLVNRSEQLGALTRQHAVPAIFQFRDFAAGGGLMSYGSSRGEQDRLVGAYAGRILKGEKPSDLPVQQTAKVELIINLKTAKALGLNVPLTLLGRADEVIE
jgi:putative ABC transport system substrate-binding protein